MSFVGNAIGSVIGGITGAKQQAQAIEAAGQLQAGQSAAGIAEERRQFDALIELMKPYVSAGSEGLTGQRALLGLEGQQAQSQAIQNIAQSPLYQNIARQGEDAILQNASATGGLRGGNTQAALAQFRPNMLNNLIQQQYAQLGGLTQLGQNAAAGQASQGMGMASNIANLLQNQGSALAQGIMAQGSVARQGFGDLLGIAKTFSNAGGIGGIKGLF